MRKWFRDYLTWMNTHAYGTKERDAENNHGTCWVMQAAEFARYVGDEKITTECRERYKNVLLPNQMAPDGSFPRELRRTKPYGYSLFNLDVMTYVVQILSVPEDNLWAFELPDGRSIKKGMEFLYPFIARQGQVAAQAGRHVLGRVAHPPRQPAVRRPGAGASPNTSALWKKLPAELKVDEVIRNVPVRQPLLWVSPARKA